MLIKIMDVHTKLPFILIFSFKDRVGTLKIAHRSKFLVIGFNEVKNYIICQKFVVSMFKEMGEKQHIKIK